ncbi:hypothetical protein L218DRAFT_504123 [Marasmius fiardii PR-910]|nr:hypothetical protein L218DRAFT_504123 [Marasmius fiardii PR-910]
MGLILMWCSIIYPILQAVTVMNAANLSPQNFGFGSMLCHDKYRNLMLTWLLTMTTWHLKCPETLPNVGALRRRRDVEGDAYTFEHVGSASSLGGRRFRI